MPKKTNIKPQLLAGAALFSLIPVTNVWAQDEDVGAQNNSFLDTIVVSATRRGEEDVQDVPIAITVNSERDLQTKRVLNIENISAVSPSVTYQQTNNSFASAGILIRGIGSIGNARSFEGSVGVFIDGVYRSRPGQALQSFLDVSSLQILRGPQGTLFGKNTSAGAVLLESNKPDFEKFGGAYTGTFGNFNQHIAQLAVNVPVSDTLALRLAGSSNHRDGFFTNGFNGEARDGGGGESFKGQVLWEPTDALSFHLIGDYGEFERNCCYATADLIEGPFTPLIDGLTQLNGGNPALANEPFDRVAFLNTTDREVQSDRGISLNTKFEGFLGGSLQGIFAWRKFSSDQDDSDADFSGADILRIDEDFETEQYSAELVYNVSPTDTIDLVLGAYYSDEDLVVDRAVAHGADAQAFYDVLIPGAIPILSTGGLATPGPLDSELFLGTTESIGVFTHLTWDLTEQLTFIGGLRWSNDDKRGTATIDAPNSLLEAAQFFGNPVITGALGPGDAGFFEAIAAANTVAAGLDPFTLLTVLPVPNNGYDETFSDSAISATAGLQFRISDAANVYATYNRGYKSGGVGLDVNANGTGITALGLLAGGVEESPLYNSEFTNSYEIGGKFIYLDGRARTNIAAFYTDISDLQIAQFEGLLFNILNAQGATVVGLEVEHQQQLTDIFSIDGGLTWLPERGIGEDPSIGHLSNRDLTRAPAIAANLGLSFAYDVSDDLGLYGRVAGQYQGEHLTSPAVVIDAQNTQEGYALLNLSAGVRLPGLGVEIEGFCQNCTDTEYVAVHFNSPLFGAPGAPDINGYLGAPRTYGVTIRGSF